MNKHYHVMHQALKLAEIGRGTVSPNPMVGAIIVKDNKVIASGYHQRAGLAHAEINALNEARAAAKDATLYVTLEPCCHHGRTPPCTDAIIKAGIKTVVIASQDPNPEVSGKGIAQLSAANIEVIFGIGEEEATKLNKIFFHYIVHQTPFVISKWAMSLDGETITHPNDTKQISSAQAQKDTHDLRHAVDAILIGANTAIHDDPALTVRYRDGACPETQPFGISKQPLRIVVSSKGNLPKHLKILNGELPGKTLIVTTDNIPASQLKLFEALQIEVCVLPSKNNPSTSRESRLVDLKALLTMLGKRQITSVLVEGGKTIHNSFFAEGLVNEVNVYLAPVFIGKLEKKLVLNQLKTTPFDVDYLFTASAPNNRTGQV